MWNLSFTDINTDQQNTKTIFKSLREIVYLTLTYVRGSHYLDLQITESKWAL